MSEELDSIRQRLQRLKATLPYPSGAQELSAEAICLLDEYERRLVKIEGVEEAYAKLKERCYANITGLDGHVVQVDLDGDCVQIDATGMDGVRISKSKLNTHIAHCIAAKMLLEGK